MLRLVDALGGEDFSGPNVPDDVGAEAVGC
jgi:hypothetical protein